MEIVNRYKVTEATGQQRLCNQVLWPCHPDRVVRHIVRELRKGSIPVNWKWFDNTVQEELGFQGRNKTSEWRPKSLRTYTALIQEECPNTLTTSRPKAGFSKEYLHPLKDIADHPLQYGNVTTQEGTVESMNGRQNK